MKKLIKDITREEAQSVCIGNHCNKDCVLADKECKICMWSRPSRYGEIEVEA